MRTGSVAELPAGPITAAAASGDQTVVVVDHRAYVVPLSLDGPATGIGPAVEVYPSHRAGRAWLLTYPADGSVVARELGLDGVEATPAAVLSGSATVRGPRARASSSTVSAPTARALAAWDPARPGEPPATFRTDALFVAATATSSRVGRQDAPPGNAICFSTNPPPDSTA